MGRRFTSAPVTIVDAWSSGRLVPTSRLKTCTYQTVEHPRTRTVGAYLSVLEVHWRLRDAMSRTITPAIHRLSLLVDAAGRCLLTQTVGFLSRNASYEIMSVRRPGVVYTQLRGQWSLSIVRT